MPETNPTNAAAPAAAPKANKPKPAPAAFDAPRFEMPKMEMPTAFRELAEKGLAQAKDHYEKMKSAAEDTTGVLQDVYTNASKGAAGYGLKVIENARTNSNAAFDLFGDLMTVKSYSEAVELSTSFWREQFDAFTAQAKDLTDVAQKAAADTIEPMKEGFSQAFNKAA